TRDPLDDYHTNDEIRAMFAAWRAAYPSFFMYDSIGMSVQGRPLLVCKLSDNVTADEPEIEVKYVANMHGDEVVGKENCLRFIEELLNGYGIDPELTQLMEEYEMWFLPCMNPDGLSLAQRGNAHGVDLNRDFPDRCDDSVNTTAGREPETAHVMNWSAAHTFILSANFHGGALVANYPWDNNCTGGAVYAPTPEDELFVWISRRYAEANPRMRVNTAFLYPDTGITNGADWYEVSGGMQDWNYVWMGDRDLTVELDNTHWPAASRLEALWQENRLAMRYYWLEAQYGVRGTVTDASTGNPIRAEVKLFNIPYLTYSSALHGDYYRMLRPGTYTLTFSAPGYGSQVFPNIVVPADSFIVLDVQLGLPPDIATQPTQLSADVGICSTTDVPLTILNEGDGPLTWYSQEGYSSQTGYGSAVGGGWRYLDGDQAGGPVYAWRDISGVGTLVSYTSDDQTRGPYAIGFDFPFYGQTFNAYYLCGNGFLSFTSALTTYTNTPLPSTAAPENLVAAWWDDLSPHRTGSQVRRYSTADSLIISFNNIQSFQDNGLYNFQFILLSSGEIVFQYASMGTSRLNSSTIGIQNGDRTRGVAVIYDQLYIHNNMAIRLCPHSMIETIPSSGLVTGHGQSVVTARFNSCCVPTGVTNGILALYSNDPDTPTLNVPVTINVTTLTPPDPVTDLTIYPDGSDVRLLWSPALNATGYKVYRLSSVEQSYLEGELLTPTAIPDTTYVDDTGDPEELRFYQVISVR
ncbi:carboxypeptidase regulatory-like domain-containing protein, partial [bacterium]|nr:carboxypeptidase regulatory-like domain-containing protein [bacterium]